MTFPAATPPSDQPAGNAAKTINPTTDGNGEGGLKAPSRLPGRMKKGRSRVWLFAALMAGVVVLAGALYFWLGFVKPPFNGPTWTVKREKLVLTIVERGSLESADNKDFVCRVKAKSQSGVATTIKWLVDDGTFVRGPRPEKPKGDKLVELDDSALQESLKDQNIKVDEARADWVRASDEYTIQLIDNENVIQKAVSDYLIARLNLEKFIGKQWQDDPGAIASAVTVLAGSLPTRPLQAASALLATTRPEGDYQAKLEDTLGKIELSRGDRDSWLERASWSRRMWKLGFMSKTQSDGDQSRLESAEYSLHKLETDLSTLQRFERIVTETDLRSKVNTAYRDLLKARLGADANKSTKDSARKAKKSVFDQQVARQNDIEEEIGKCKMYAPTDGLAVYFIPESTRGGFGKQALVAVGENVSEGQKILQIPDLTRMVVNTRVHEAMVAHVLSGQRVKVRIEAHAGRSLKGHVTVVKNAPSAQDFLSSDVKLYPTIVAIDDNVEDLNLKPGLSAEVTIFADESTGDVLSIPIQSVVGNIQMGQKRKCFVIGADGQPEERDIVVGMNNDKIVEVSEGLKEGDVVVINPIPLLVGENSKLKAGVPSTRQQGEGGEGGSGKKKAKGVMAPGVPAAPGAAQKAQWEEKMKDLTPEQRKAALEKYKKAKGKE